MGCNHSTDGSMPRRQYSLSKRARKYAHSPPNGPDSSQTTLGDMNTYRKETELRSLSDLNILYTDFVGERYGKIRDFYTLIDPAIGKGAYGEVKKAIHKKTGVERAVKIIPKGNSGPKAQERLVNEVNMLKKLDHPNIMKIHEFFQDSKHFYIVTDLYDGGELFEKIASMRFFTEKWAAGTMKQILSAISYCHKNNIVHRDLKPENVLYESRKPDALIKIIDFGTSNLYDPHREMHQRFGTPYYIAPEVIKQKYTEKCDVWSCGVMLYILLCGFPPFNGDSEKEILSNVVKGNFSFDFLEWGTVSNKAKALVKRMLELDPAKRITAEEALQDPWFKLVLGEPEFDKPLAVSTLTNLRNFRAEQKLQSAIYMFLVNLLASYEEKAQLLKTFRALDLNGDGKLSREELIQGYSNLMGSPDPKADAEAVMKEVDNNNSGAIDYTEFVIATVNRENMLKKEKLEAAFSYIDKNGDGYLQPEEIAEVFNGRHRRINEKVWEELISEFDLNGDGKISLAEFKDMMRRLLIKKDDDGSQLNTPEKMGYETESNGTIMKSPKSDEAVHIEEGFRMSLDV